MFVGHVHRYDTDSPARSQQPRRLSKQSEIGISFEMFPGTMERNSIQGFVGHRNRSAITSNPVSVNAARISLRNRRYPI